jgi:hypothetical protein
MVGDGPEEFSVPVAKGNSYLARHWRGELSLATSYWVNSVLLVGLGCTLVAMLALPLHPGIRIIAVIAVLVANIWAIVGTWRAAFSGPAARRDSYFARHWRGELSLATSYWINGLLLVGLGCIFTLALALRMPIEIARSAFGSGSQSAVVVGILAVTAILGQVALYFVMSIWAIVGTWRSASKRKRSWGAITKLGTILMAFVYFILFFVNLDVLINPVR